MTQSYYTSDHFKLLNKWKGQKRDESNPEQNRAYKELKQAYEVTANWANELKKLLFSEGYCKLRRSPTNQQSNFLPYNWARIYPTKSSPGVLAYTIGIDCNDGFFVKLDLVDSHIREPGLRSRYDEIRGPYHSSPIVAILPMEKGLGMSFTDLVDWSVEAIQNFKINYDTVAEKLGLIEKLGDLSILQHFDGKQEFKEFRAIWSPETTILFCRIVRTVHSAGLDWYHGRKPGVVKFGRKAPGSQRATGILGVLRGAGAQNISLKQAIGDVSELHRRPITEELVNQLEDAFMTNVDAIQSWLPAESVRKGYWPDELQDEPVDPGDEAEDAEIPMIASRAAFNHIYYGPPGTGKTYELQQLLDREYTQKITTLSVSEWTEQQIVELIQDLTWWEVLAAALYDLGGKASVNVLMDHTYVQALITSRKRAQNVRQTIWGSLQQHALEESATVKVKNRIAPYIFDKTESSEWFFVNDWREQCAELLAKVDAIKNGPQGSSESIKRYEFVTFHQSFGYEEFVESLRPVLDGETSKLGYEIRRGTFLRLCDRARKNPMRQYAMVIDEINRGNISKIFGELITLIEVDKREGAKYPVSVTLPYSGELFSVPANVDVIGTMNTADRSLALVDTALRRRFEFIESMPQPAILNEILVSSDGVDINVEHLLEMLNRRIEALYDRDHTIGHAYFTCLKDVSSADQFSTLKSIFKNKIIPLLEEYFFEDWQKIRLVLGDNQKQNSQHQFVQEISRDEDIMALFGNEHELDQYAIRSRYQLNANALDHPMSYVGIYAPTVEISTAE